MSVVRKRGLAACMAVLLVLSGFPVMAQEPALEEQVDIADAVENAVSVSGNNENIASGVDGDITWVIDAGGKLTLEGTGDLLGNGYEHTREFAWKPYSNYIVSAEIRVSGMTDAAYLFSDCENMTSVDLSAFDTGSVTNMRYMFFGCNSLASLDVSGLDTRNVISMEGMFWGCSSLTSLDLSSLDTGSVMDTACMFHDCSSLTSLDVSGLDTGDVTWMSEMFWGCSSLTSLDVSSLDTSSVTNMGYMFYGCSGLTSLDVSGFDTGNVTDMDYMFWGCSNLKNLDVSGFDTANATNMGGMFLNCSSLENLDMSGFDTSSVTHMGNMFSGCSSLTSLDVSGFNTSNVRDMEYMFAGCNSLTSLDVSGFDTANVTDMGEMFWDCGSLENLDVSSFNTGNVKTMELMFHGCSSLKSLDVSGFNTANVTNMNAMFAGCSGLTGLDVGKFDTGNVTNMGMMFTDCSGLESLDVGNFDTANVTSMNAMFSGCSALTDLNASGFNIGNVTADSSSGDMFANCVNLTTLQSPYNVIIPVLLPVVQGMVWQLPDKTQVTKLPQGLNYSVTLTRISDTPQIITTTPDLNMEDVVRVKYVPYSYTVETSNTNAENTVTFSIVEGRLAKGLQMYPTTGEIYGVPLEAGEFKIRVMAEYGNSDYLPSYAELTLIVLDNTDDNVGVSTDPGYEITQPVTDFNMASVSGEGTQTLISQGEYDQFTHKVFLDGRELTEGEGKDYTSEAGSTRITILNQTLTSGGTGTHTLGVEFRMEDGTLKRAAQNYTVSSTKPGVDDNIKPDGGDNTKPNEDNNSGTNNNGNNTSASANTSTVGTTPSASAESPQQDFIIYAVERGDSLWKIAVKFYGQGSSWRKIYEDNALAIRNPGRLYTGQKLVIRLTGAEGAVSEISVLPISTEALEGTSYRVQKGDRLWTIARRAYGSGRLWNIIYEANRDIIADPERIRAGQVINIPQR